MSSPGRPAARSRRRSVATVVRRAAGLLGELLVTLGVLVLLFTVWQLWWTDLTAGRAQAATTHHLEQQFRAPSPNATGAPGTSTSLDHLPTLKEPAVGTAFAIIRVPRFGKDYARPVIEGTGTDQLSQGVGHYVGTAMPGQVGNFAVAGHRTTYAKPFTHIERLRRGDAIIIETKAGYYVYRVQRHLIVTPDQVDVIARVPQHPKAKPHQRWMTMTSCHPRFYSTYRWVTFSKFQQAIPRAQGLPASLLNVPGKGN